MNSNRGTISGLFFLCQSRNCFDKVYIYIYIFHRLAFVVTFRVRIRVKDRV